MGLDRDAGALLLIQTDAPGAAAGRRGRRGHRGLRGGRRQGGLRHRRPRGGRAVRAGPAPALHAPSRPAARCCPRTSACRSRSCRPCSPPSRPSPQRHDVEIPVVAHAGDGNTHPAIIYAPGRRRRRAAGPGSPSTRSWRPPSSSAARSPASTGSGRLKARLARGPARPRRHGPDPPGQARPRPARHPQPRRRLLTPAMGRSWTRGRIAASTEGTASRRCGALPEELRCARIIGFIVIWGSSGGETAGRDRRSMTRCPRRTASTGERLGSSTNGGFGGDDGGGRLQTSLSRSRRSGACRP